MRNLVPRVGPETSSFPPSGRDAKFSGSSCHASKHSYLLSFCHIGTPEAAREINIGHLWSHHVNYTSIWNQNRNHWHHEDNIWSLMTPENVPHAYNVSKAPLSSHKVPRIMRAKAKKTPMCSASLIAIKLKGLAAPGEALKISSGNLARKPTH